MTTEDQNQEQDSPQGEAASEGTQTAPRARRGRAVASSDAGAGDAVAAEESHAAEGESTEATAEADSGDAVAAEKPAAKSRPRRTPRSRSEPETAEASTEAASGDADGDAPPKEAAPRRRRRSASATAEDKAEAEPKQDKTPIVQRPMPRMLEKLRNEVGPQLMQEFGYTSPMQIPHLQKIVLNIGLGEALLNPRAMEAALRDITAITGQKPLTTRAKKSIAGFKIRDGMAIGVSVTLRGRRMYEFYDRLVSSTLPRIRDFQGTSREAFDGRGNYSLGIREQVIFPEIDYNSIDRIRGLQVVIATSARSDIEGLRLLELMGMPFARVRDREMVT